MIDNPLKFSVVLNSETKSVLTINFQEKLIIFEENKNRKIRIQIQFNEKDKIQFLNNSVIIFDDHKIVTNSFYHRKIQEKLNEAVGENIKNVNEPFYDEVSNLDFDLNLGYVDKNAPKEINVYELIKSKKTNQSKIIVKDPIPATSKERKRTLLESANLMKSKKPVINTDRKNHIYPMFECQKIDEPKHVKYPEKKKEKLITSQKPNKYINFEEINDWNYYNKDSNNFKVVDYQREAFAIAKEIKKVKNGNNDNDSKLDLLHIKGAYEECSEIQTSQYNQIKKTENNESQMKLNTEIKEQLTLDQIKEPIKPSITSVDYFGKNQLLIPKAQIINSMEMVKTSNAAEKIIINEQNPAYHLLLSLNKNNKKQLVDVYLERELNKEQINKKINSMTINEDIVNEKSYEEKLRELKVLDKKFKSIVARKEESHDQTKESDYSMIAENIFCNENGINKNNNEQNVIILANKLNDKKSIDIKNVNEVISQKLEEENPKTKEIKYKNYLVKVKYEENNNNLDMTGSTNNKNIEKEKKKKEKKVQNDSIDHDDVIDYFNKISIYTNKLDQNNKNETNVKKNKGYINFNKGEMTKEELMFEYKVKNNVLNNTKNEINSLSKIIKEKKNIEGNQIDINFGKSNILVNNLLDDWEL